jgi:hypothetical protein
MRSMPGDRVAWIDAVSIARVEVAGHREAEMRALMTARSSSGEMPFVLPPIPSSTQWSISA